MRSKCIVNNLPNNESLLAIMSKVFELCDKKWQNFTSSSAHLSSVSKVTPDTTGQVIG